MTSKRIKTLQHSFIFFSKKLKLIVYACLGLICVSQMLFVIAEDIEVGNNEEYIVNNKQIKKLDNIVFSGGSVLVTGTGSELVITAGLPPIPPSGKGWLAVTGKGTVSLKDTGMIFFDGNALFDNGYLIQNKDTLLDVGDGRIDFDNGTIVTSTGTLNAKKGVHFNTGSILHVTGADGVLNVTDGNLIFRDQSTLEIMIGKSGGTWNASQIIVASDSQEVILSGNLLVTPEYGYYNTPLEKKIIITDQIVANIKNISGPFANTGLSNDRYGKLRVEYSDNDVTLFFDPNATPYSSFTQTFNERNVGEVFDAIHQQQLPVFQPLMQETWTKSDAELRALYSDLSGEIRAHSMALPLAAPGRMAFDRVTWDSSTGHVAFGPQYRLAATGSRRAAWFRPYYVNDRVKSDGNASRYTTDGYGFVGGLDQTLVGGKTAVGVMIGYGRPELKTRNDKANLDDFLIGAHFATRILDAYEIKAWGGYSAQYYDMQRQINFMGASQTVKSNFKGRAWTVSGELSRPIYTMSRLVLKPTVGYDGLYLTQDATDETGNNLVALSYHKTSIERHIGRIGLNAEYGDSARSLYGGAHYKYLLGGDQVYYSQASFVGGGPAFVVNSVDLGKAFISGNIGLQINLSDDRSRLFFVDYTADFGDNSTFLQMATVGLQQTF